MNDRSKLPKWAQQEIGILERSLAHAKAALAAGPEDSDTFADPYIDKRPLGRGTTIEFHLGGDRKLIRVRVDGDRLNVNGNDSIAVFPAASNSLEIKLLRPDTETGQG